jgi:hypothetical protein
MSSNRLLQLLDEKSFECKLYGDKKLHILNINDTRILPCGNLCCFNCFKKLFEKKLKSKQSYLCPLCNNIHLIENSNLLPRDNEICNMFNLSIFNYLKKIKETINKINGPEGKYEFYHIKNRLYNL